MSCNSFNIIYVVICSVYWEEYIGETGVGNKKIKRQGQSIQNPKMRLSI